MEQTYTAFAGFRQVSTGPLENLLPELRSWLDQGANELLLIFDDLTGKQVDFDLRYAPPPARTGPGRPRLGVVSREISLLPRHWEWLEQQPSGASAAIRRLVDEARKRDPGKQQARLAREAAGRFLSAMAGNLPGYEEATRALYAGQAGRFEELIRDWPPDVLAHAQRMAQGSFE